MVSGISAYETEMAGCCMVTVGASPVANVTANEPVLLPRRIEPPVDAMGKCRRLILPP